MSEQRVRFLSLANVLRIHDDTLREEGGSAGIRDIGLLESAIAMPRSTFGGAYLHEGLADMAGAYLFHLCQNPAFVDGNKREAAFAAVLFLTLNGLPDEALPAPADLERATLAVASGSMGKAEVIGWMRSLNPASMMEGIEP